MLHRLSLRMRLSLLLGAVLALGLAMGIGLMILHAGARVGAEAEAATRLARELVEASAPRLASAVDPKVEIARLLADAKRLRHVRVTLDDGTAPQDARESRAPDWFAALILRKSAAARVETPRNGTFVIASNPADEIAEVWEEVVALAIGGAGVAIAVFALVAFAVSRTLRPVATLAETLLRIERGDHSVRVPGDGSPEFVVIAERINSLAATLQTLDEENHRLVRRMLSVQDEERRDIARDLHDEIGPFLFTVRAGVGALLRRTASPGADPAQLAEACARIDAQLASLQQINRRILGRLRPAALDEMGIADALQALAQGWRQTHPQVEIVLLLDDLERHIDEVTALTAYRIVQEGLTNAFRHSGANRIEVVVARDADAMRIDVRDNGAGVDAAATLSNGLGLRGMSERVGALGGSVALTSLPAGGACLRAVLPLSGRQQQETRTIIE